MNKKFNIPVIEIITFKKKDVIVTSLFGSSKTGTTNETFNWKK